MLLIFRQQDWQVLPKCSWSSQRANLVFLVLCCIFCIQSCLFQQDAFSSLHSNQGKQACPQAHRDFTNWNVTTLLLSQELCLLTYSDKSIFSFSAATELCFCAVTVYNHVQVFVCKINLFSIPTFQVWSWLLLDSLSDWWPQGCDTHLPLL